MRGRRCLSDQLRDQGYVTEYVVGGDLAFGGINHS